MTDFSISHASRLTVSSQRRWVVVGLLSMGMTVAYLSRSNISVVLAMPDFVKLFHLSDTDRGAVNSAFFWAYAALQVPAGWLVDRYGVKFLTHSVSRSGASSRPTRRLHVRLCS
jgi:fucose permease